MSAISTAVSVGICLLFSGAEPAFGQTAEQPAIREQRRLLLGINLPDELLVAGHDVTVPLPGMRVSVNLSSRLAVGLAAGGLPFEASGRWSTLHADFRYYLGEKHWSPYLLAGAGVWLAEGGDGGDRSYPFTFAGAGLEYASAMGFTVWGELAPAAIAYTDGSDRSAAAGVYGALGLGYRVRTSW